MPSDIVPMPTNVTVLENEVSCVFLIRRATNKGKFIYSQVYNTKKISDIWPDILTRKENAIASILQANLIIVHFLFITSTADR